MSEPMPGIARLALRTALAAVLLSGLAHAFGRPIVEALRPALAATLQWLAADFKLLDLRIVREGPDLALEARAVQRSAFVLGGRTIAPDGHTGFAVTTTLGTVLQPLLAALLLASVWPGRAPLPLRGAFALGLSVPVMLLDAPTYLWASLWDMQLRAFDPQRGSPWQWWMGFLAGGGRLALGLLAGACALALAEAAARVARRVRRADARGDAPRRAVKEIP